MNHKLRREMQYARTTGAGWEWDADNCEWVLYLDDEPVRYADTAPWEEEESWHHLL